MISGIVKNLDNCIPLTFLYSTNYGANIFKTVDHICPRCQKNEWVLCPDAIATFISCFSSQCLKFDSDVTKSQAKKRYEEKMNVLHINSQQKALR